MESLGKQRIIMGKKQIQIYAQLCEACVFGTETDIEHGHIDNYLWCEIHCWLTRLGQTCSSFMPKRKYDGKVIFYIPDEEN